MTRVVGRFPFGRPSIRRSPRSPDGPAALAVLGGSVGAAGGNGSSGLRVVEHVLRPLGVDPAAVFFTDCLPTYFVKDGPGSQGQRIRTVYEPFAAVTGCQPADLPVRPKPSELVRLAVKNESRVLIDQLAGSAAPRIVTLGQEAADVLTGITGAPRVRLSRGPGYGEPISIELGGSRREWLPLTRPGNRSTDAILADLVVSSQAP